jgi:hypothetical protein
VHCRIHSLVDADIAGWVKERKYCSRGRVYELGSLSFRCVVALRWMVWYTTVSTNVGTFLLRSNQRRKRLCRSRGMIKRKRAYSLAGPLLCSAQRFGVDRASVHMLQIIRDCGRQRRRCLGLQSWCSNSLIQGAMDSTGG